MPFTHECSRQHDISKQAIWHAGLRTASSRHSAIALQGTWSAGLTVAVLALASVSIVLFKNVIPCSWGVTFLRSMRGASTATRDATSEMVSLLVKYRLATSGYLQCIASGRTCVKSFWIDSAHDLTVLTLRPQLSWSLRLLVPTAVPRCRRRSSSLRP